MLRLTLKSFAWLMFFAFALLSITIAQRNAAFKIGSAAEWFEYACGIELNSYPGSNRIASSGAIYPKIEGWHIYAYNTHHERIFFKISEDKLMENMPEAMTLINHEISSMKVPHQWQKYDPNMQKRLIEDKLSIKNRRRTVCFEAAGTGKTNNQKLTSIGKARVAKDKESQEKALLRWQRGQALWLTCVFEIAFLWCWWIFTLWPYFSSNSKLGWFFHLGASPLLLMLPHYLGFAPLLFTHGPSGAYAYSASVILFTLPFTIPVMLLKPAWLYEMIDRHILAIFPKPLGAISQGPSSPLAVSFWGYVSPTVLLIYLGLMILMGQWWNKRKK